MREQLKTSDCIRKYWHVTPVENLPEIAGRGLEPRIGKLSKKFGEKIERIYLFSNFNDVVDAMQNWLGHEYEDIELCILELVLPNEMILERGAGYEVYVDATVSPEKIFMLVDDVDNWTGNYPLEPAISLLGKVCTDGPRFDI